MNTKSDDKPRRRLRPTAHLEVVADGHILRLEAAGPFSKALVIYLFLMGRNLLADTVRQNIPYAVVITFHQSLRMTPDAIQQLIDLLDDTERRGGPPPLATAYVINPEIEGARLMLPILADIYRKTRAFEAFSSGADADAWVHSLLGQAGTHKAQGEQKF